MLQRCRPAGRLFYLALAMVACGWYVGSDASIGIAAAEPGTASSPTAEPAADPEPRAASPSPQSGPALTSVIEVRENDFGWGQANDRNLLGRFNTETFTLSRLAAVQDYYLRLYDNSSPPRYSRYSAALHVDQPL
jgi:hypothetical protein